MKNWKAIVGVIVVFLLGVLAGGLVAARVVHHRIHRATAAGPDAVADMMVRRLTWRLRLDGAQREQLRLIIHDAQQEMKPVRLQTRQIVQEAEGKLRVVLRPDQQEKLDQLVAERTARWREAQP